MILLKKITTTIRYYIKEIKYVSWWHCTGFSVYRFYFPALALKSGVLCLPWITLQFCSVRAWRCASQSILPFSFWLSSYAEDYSRVGTLHLIAQFWIRQSLPMILYLLESAWYGFAPHLSREKVTQRRGYGRLADLSDCSQGGSRSCTHQKDTEPTSFLG